MKEFLSSVLFLRILFSLLTFLIAWLLAAGIIRIINRTVKDLKRQHSLRKTTVYITTCISLFIILLIWIQRGTSVTTTIGFMGAGLTLALHQPVMSIAGWILILIRRPYETGDRIEIGGVKGDVIDIRLFYTSLLEIGNWVDADQSTGRIIHCPNGKVFTEPIFNYTRGFEHIWDEIKITVTYESDWKKARDIILEAAARDNVDVGEKARTKIRNLSKKYLIFFEKLTPIVWTNIMDFGVELTLRYLTEARRRRSSMDTIAQYILDRFNAESDVDFAYPTYRIYKQDKDLTRGSKTRPPEDS